MAGACRRKPGAQSSDGKSKQERKRRPVGFWQVFNDWFRAELSRLGRRPVTTELVRWYAEEAHNTWESPDERPTWKETRVHAKCLRSVEEVKLYFRKYRKSKSKQEDPDGALSGEDDESDEEDEEGDADEDASTLVQPSHRSMGSLPRLTPPLQQQQRYSRADSLGIHSSAGVIMTKGDGGSGQQAVAREPWHSKSAVALKADPDDRDLSGGGLTARYSQPPGSSSKLAFPLSLDVFARPAAGASSSDGEPETLSPFARMAAAAICPSLSHGHHQRFVPPPANRPANLSRLILPGGGGARSVPSEAAHASPALPGSAGGLGSTGGLGSAAGGSVASSGAASHATFLLMSNGSDAVMSDVQHHGQHRGHYFRHHYGGLPSSGLPSCASDASGCPTSSTLGCPTSSTTGGFPTSTGAAGGVGNSGSQLTGPVFNLELLLPDDKWDTEPISPATMNELNQLLFTPGSAERRALGLPEYQEQRSPPAGHGRHAQPLSRLGQPSLACTASACTFSDNDVDQYWGVPPQLQPLLTVSLPPPLPSPMMAPDDFPVHDLALAGQCPQQSQVGRLWQPHSARSSGRLQQYAAAASPTRSSNHSPVQQQAGQVTNCFGGFDGGFMFGAAAGRSPPVARRSDPGPPPCLDTLDNDAMDCGTYGGGSYAQLGGQHAGLGGHTHHQQGHHHSHHQSHHSSDLSAWERSRAALGGHLSSQSPRSAAALAAAAAAAAARPCAGRTNSNDMSLPAGHHAGRPAVQPAGQGGGTTTSLAEAAAYMRMRCTEFALEELADSCGLPSFAPNVRRAVGSAAAASGDGGAAYSEAPESPGGGSVLPPPTVLTPTAERPSKRLACEGSAAAFGGSLQLPPLPRRLSAEVGWDVPELLAATAVAEAPSGKLPSRHWGRSHSAKVTPQRPLAVGRCEPFRHPSFATAAPPPSSRFLLPPRSNSGSERRRGALSPKAGGVGRGRWGDTGVTAWGDVSGTSGFSAVATAFAAQQQQHHHHFGGGQDVWPSPDTFAGVERSVHSATAAFGGGHEKSAFHGAAAQLQHTFTAPATLQIPTDGYDGGSAGACGGGMASPALLCGSGAAGMASPALLGGGGGLASPGLSGGGGGSGGMASPLVFGGAGGGGLDSDGFLRGSLVDTYVNNLSIGDEPDPLDYDTELFF